MQTRAAVTVGRRKSVVEHLSLPQTGERDGILRVEGSGVCGSDVVSFDLESQARRVMGHETVGTIVAAGRGAVSRWGFDEGDRVLLEEYLPCGHCAFCRSAEFRFCLESDTSVSRAALRYGSTPLSVPPGVWGGFSEFQYLHERTVMHRVPDSLPSELATMALPFANGHEWAYLTGGVGPGKSIVIFGPGQQGLGCVLSSRVAGAAAIVVIGLPGDESRLKAAEALGATHSFVDGPDLVDRVLGATNGEGVDITVDTAAGTRKVFNTSTALLRKSGRMVLPVRSGQPQDGVLLEALSRKALTAIGVRGHSFAAVERAIELISTRIDLLRPLAGGSFGLDRVSEAILATGRLLPGRQVIHATVDPWAADGMSLDVNHGDIGTDR